MIARKLFLGSAGAPPAKPLESRQGSFFIHAGETPNAAYFLLAGEKQPRSGCVREPRVGRIFCGQPWEIGIFGINPERVECSRNPFRVEVCIDLLPRVERHKTPLNPGLRDNALSGHLNGAKQKVCGIRRDAGVPGLATLGRPLMPRAGEADFA